jgi:hypothetical protein
MLHFRIMKKKSGPESEGARQFQVGSDCISKQYQSFSRPVLKVLSSSKEGQLQKHSVF